MRKVAKTLILIICLLFFQSNSVQISSYSEDLSSLKTNAINCVTAITTGYAPTIFEQVTKNVLAFNDLYKQVIGLTANQALPLVADKFTQLSKSYSTIGSMINTIIGDRDKQLTLLKGVQSNCLGIIQRAVNDIQTLNNRISQLDQLISKEPNATQILIYQSERSAKISEINSLNSIKGTFQKFNDFLTRLITAVIANNDQVKLLLYTLKFNADVYDRAADAARTAYEFSQLEGQLPNLEDINVMINNILTNWTDIDNIINDISSIQIGG